MCAADIPIFPTKVSFRCFKQTRAKDLPYSVENRSPQLRLSGYNGAAAGASLGIKGRPFFLELASHFVSSHASAAVDT